MSRVGKQPISIPQGVEIKIEKNRVTAKGKLGELSQTVDRDLKIEKEEDQLILRPVSDDPQLRPKHGLYRNLLNNIHLVQQEKHSERSEAVETFGIYLFFIRMGTPIFN